MENGSQTGEKTMPNNGLETVFSEMNQWHDRIFYDVKEGKYYDKYTDLYLENDELKAYGL